MAHSNFFKMKTQQNLKIEYVYYIEMYVFLALLYGMELWYSNTWNHLKKEIKAFEVHMYYRVLRTNKEMLKQMNKNWKITEGGKYFGHLMRKQEPRWLVHSR